MHLNHGRNFESSNPVAPLRASGAAVGYAYHPLERGHGDAPPLATARCKVLLIDDEIPPTNPLVRLLTCEGFTVDCAATGAQALAKANDDTYDAIVLDLRLPDLPGLVVLARLRARGNTTPVLILTAFGDFQSACVAGRFGADRFMTKPVFSELGTAVRDLLNRPPSAAVSSHSRVPPVSASVETLAIATLLEHLNGLTTRGGPGAMRRPAGAPPPSRDEIRQTLLAVLFRGVLDPALPVPCFAASAKALRHALSAGQTEPPSETASLAESCVMEALEYHPTDLRVTMVIDRLKAAVSACRHPTEDEIAQGLNVHASHLGRMLKAETGLSFRCWRTGLVMKILVCHLAETNEQVAQIAYRYLGYEHPSQLDREFHETFGFSPREFRRMWRELKSIAV